MTIGSIGLAKRRLIVSIHSLTKRVLIASNESAIDKHLIFCSKHARELVAGSWLVWLDTNATWQSIMDKCLGALPEGCTAAEHRSNRMVDGR